MWSGFQAGASRTRTSNRDSPAIFRDASFLVARFLCRRPWLGLQRRQFPAAVPIAGDHFRRGFVPRLNANRRSYRSMLCDRAWHRQLRFVRHLGGVFRLYLSFRTLHRSSFGGRGHHHRHVRCRSNKVRFLQRDCHHPLPRPTSAASPTMAPRTHRSRPMSTTPPPGSLRRMPLPPPASTGSAFSSRNTRTTPPPPPSLLPPALLPMPPSSLPSRSFTRRASRSCSSLMWTR